MADFYNLDQARAALDRRDAESASLLTEDQLAAQFTKIYGAQLRYVAEWGKWLRWTGQVWKADLKLEVFDLVRGVCREASQAATATGALNASQAGRLKSRVQSAATTWSVARLAGTDPRHALTAADLDADPWSLNTPGGVLNLKTGEMHPHDPAAHHTKITAVAPGGDCPLWDQLLKRALPDPEVRDYLQRLAGYALTGSAREHVLPFVYGTGANGKGTVFHALRAVLGDYGLEIPAETLMEATHDRHLTELAVLRGARLVIGSEIDVGKRWNESRLKRLTGGDPISARFIARDLFEFLPSHALVIIGNHKPGIRSVDEAIRRRIHLIDFGVKIPESEQDTELPAKLVGEFAGILRWAVAGCLQWQKHGLAAPASIRAATDSYLNAEDSVNSWISENCVRSGQITLKAAHGSYMSWCESNAAHPLGRNTLGDQLEARGFRRFRESRTPAPLFSGLSLPTRTDWQDTN